MRFLARGRNESWCTRSTRALLRRSDIEARVSRARKILLLPRGCSFLEYVHALPRFLDL